jgi:photosystem II stability/assembly factor-like uncharacterized protein
MTLRPSLVFTLPMVAALALAVAAAPPASGADDPPVAYQWLETPTGSTEQFRGLDAVSADVAWLAGETGTVLRTTDAGVTWDDVSPSDLGDFVPEFRDIEAWDADHAVALAIGVGEASRVYETTDGGATWSERFRNTDPDPASFYDCMAFSDSGRGLALSDPVGGYFRLALTRDFGHTWRVQSTEGMPPALDGEFAFAASGTCLVSGPWRNYWFATGGVDAPRIFHSTDGGRTWDVTDTPLRGGPSAGVYSLDFRSIGKGVMVGGDFADETNGADAAAYLTYQSDGWAPSAESVLGYRSGVAFIPTSGNTVIAVGPTGSDASFNGGRTWTGFDTTAYDSVSCASSGACWASGPNGAAARLGFAGGT